MDENERLARALMGQRFGRWEPEALAGGPEAKAGLVGKFLGLMGLDESGNRAATSWTDAAKHTASNVINAPQDIANQLLSLQEYQPVYGTAGDAEDRALAGRQAGEVFGLAGLAPVAGAGLTRAMRPAVGRELASELATPNDAALMQNTKAALEARIGRGEDAIATALYSNSKEAALPGMVVQGYRGHSAEHGIGPRPGKPQAVFATPDEFMANAFAQKGGTVSPVEMRFSNPYVVDAEGAQFWRVPLAERDGLLGRMLGPKRGNMDELTRRKQAEGHDGIVAKNVEEVGYDGTSRLADQYVALQRGTVFDPATGNLLWSNPKEASLPGLLMDQESRLARAREMGFDTDTTWYHKTKTDFDQFAPFSHFGTAEQANMRAVGDGAQIMPTHIRNGNYVRQRDTGDWSQKKLNALQRKGADGVRYLNRYEGIPLESIERAAERVGGMDKLDALSDTQFRKLVPESQESLIVFDPTHIRSKFAAFDPAKADSANLLAANSDRASLPGITAYHGSPHDFERFSMDKIGTGEGVQAYGHGLYFAENEGVARSYRDGLSKWQASLDGRPIVELWAEGKLPEALANKTGLSRQDAIGAANIVSEAVRTGRPVRDVVADRIQRANDAYPPEMAADEVRKLTGISQKVDPIVESLNPGHMYEVRINAAPEDFLDWDKPLSQQNDKVREAVTPIHRILYANEPGFTLDNSTARDIVNGVQAGGQNVTNALRDAGIPGIRYLDQGSRGAGEGSRNLVVFDDKIIDIVRKYGWAGAAAMLGMTAEDLQTKALAESLAGEPQQP